MHKRRADTTRRLRRSSRHRTVRDNELDHFVVIRGPNDQLIIAVAPGVVVIVSMRPLAASPCERVKVLRRARKLSEGACGWVLLPFLGPQMRLELDEANDASFAKAPQQHSVRHLLAIRPPLDVELIGRELVIVRDNQDLSALRLRQLDDALPLQLLAIGDHWRFKLGKTVHAVQPFAGRCEPIVFIPAASSSETPPSAVSSMNPVEASSSERGAPPPNE